MSRCISLRGPWPRKCPWGCMVDGGPNRPEHLNEICPETGVEFVGGKPSWTVPTELGMVRSDLRLSRRRLRIAVKALRDIHTLRDIDEIPGVKIRTTEALDNIAKARRGRGA